MLGFVKEAAEYYLLFSGTILALGAGTISDTLWSRVLNLMTRLIAAILNLKAVRAVIGKHAVNVNSIWQASPSQELQSPQGSRSHQLPPHMPRPVGACLKWAVTTGHVALFSAFVAFGN